MVQVLTQCGDELTLNSVMTQAANRTDFSRDTLSPGIKIDIGNMTSPRSSSSGSRVESESCLAVSPVPELGSGKTTAGFEWKKRSLGRREIVRGERLSKIEGPVFKERRPGSRPRSVNRVSRAARGRASGYRLGGNCVMISILRCDRTPCGSFSPMVARPLEISMRL